MRRATRITPLVALGVFATFGGLIVSAQEKSPDPKTARGPRALKIGVVDIGVLFKTYKRKDLLEEKINEQRESMKEEIKKESERIKDLTRRLQTSQMREGSDPWLRATTDIRLANYALELKQERMQGALKKQVERHTLMILTELEKTIEVYGSKYGYDLVLKIDRAGGGAIVEEGKGDLVAHFQERIFRAQISDVLYFNDRALNITKNIERLLNSPANLRAMERLSKEGPQERRKEPK